MRQFRLNVVAKVVGIGFLAFCFVAFALNPLGAVGMLVGGTVGAAAVIGIYFWAANPLSELQLCRSCVRFLEPDDSTASVASHSG